MSTKHTPGPWLSAEYGSYSDYEGRCRVILGEGGDIRTAVVLGLDTPENAANARLIAAAPDLLEALRLYVAAGFGNSTSFEAQGRAYDSAVEAIAKATGQKGGAA